MNRIIRYISTVKSRPSAGLRAAGSIMAVCVAGFVALTLWGCQRKELQVQEYMAVVSIIDGSSTKSIPEDSAPQINDIAIFAFSGDTLVGYIYESDLAGSGKTIFPMTLTKGGIIDFYVVANSEPGFFKVVDQNGTEVRWSSSSTVNPPAGVTPEYLEKCTVKFSENTPSESDIWYAPMSNLPVSSNGNRRFNVDGEGLTSISIDLTRAVSKVKIWFRAKNNLNPINPSEPSRGRYYYRIDNISLTMPVADSPLFVEKYSNIISGDPKKESDIFSQENFQMNFPVYSEGAGGFYYDEPYFIKIAEYYVLPNSIGGDQVGDLFNNGDSSKSTKLDVKWSYIEANNPGGVDWNWTDQYSKTKTIFLPSAPRNYVINVWCDFTDDVDRSFTYTVVDWDETITVDVPDFE